MQEYGCEVSKRGKSYRLKLSGWEKAHTPRKKTVTQAEPPKVKELQTEYAKLLEEKKKTYAEYRRSREEMRELLTAKANVDRVLKMEVEQDVEKEKDHGQR